jgi:hypothetical protein
MVTKAEVVARIDGGELLSDVAAEIGAKEDEMGDWLRMLSDESPRKAAIERRSGQLVVWVPSNRKYEDGRPRAMDGINELIAKSRTGYNVGAAAEKNDVRWCKYNIMRAMAQQGWKPMRFKEDAFAVDVHLKLVETNTRRDVPNIIGGAFKYVFDALSRPRAGNGVKDGASAIYDDSQKWLKGITWEIEVDPSDPGIEITVRRHESEQG